MTNEEIIESLSDLVVWYDAANHDYYGCANVRMDKADREACASAIKAFADGCDAVSREKVLQIVRAWFDRDAKPSELKNEIENLPSVLPNKKIGQKRKNNV